MAGRLQIANLTFEGRRLVEDVFIETGTNLGASLEVAMHAGFRELHSIEVFEPLFAKSVEKFRGHDKVHLHLGSSPDVLPRCINRSRKTLFWLDAHYSGADRAEQDGVSECPLLRELAVIFAEPWRHDPVLMIDDAHMFDDRIPAAFNRAHWPRVSAIQAALPAGYTITELDGILYAIPASSSH